MFGLNQKEVLEKMQKSLEESKAKLAELRVVGEAGSGLVKIELNGNRELTSLELNANIRMMDKDALENYLTIALRNAIEKANQANETEMAQSARQILPGL